MCRFALLFSPIILLSACDTDSLNGDTDGTDDTVDRVARVVVSPDGGIGHIVDSHNTLAWDLYGELADDDDDNIFFSPFSTTAALSMTYAGAEQATQTEMEDVLNVDLLEDTWHQAVGEYIQDLNGELGRGYTLTIANQLFGQTGYPFEPAFLEVCEQDYDAPLENWDFISDPEGGRQNVNSWVEDHTNDRIVDLLPQGSVTGDTRLILANAIYFLADWETAFDPEDTVDRPFTISTGSEVTVPMMYMDIGGMEDTSIETGRTEGLALVKLPYQDNELSMILIVPDAVDGLADVEAQLSQETFDGWLAALRPSDATLFMPKFTLEYQAELSTPLIDLGMPSAFDSSIANFTGIADAPDVNLFITGVVHKAFVAVDELGTEAAAATAVVVGTESAADFINVDHPFLFAIRDDLTGAILFVGRVTDPS
jgi:serpin B